MNLVVETVDPFEGLLLFVLILNEKKKYTVKSESISDLWLMNKQTASLAHHKLESNVF